MKLLGITTFVCLLSSCMLWPWLRSHAACAGTESQSCKLVMDALEAASKVKAGMLRADVAKAFELDGGITFQDKAIYTYKHCHYIKIEVEFQRRDIAPTAEGYAPEDTITKVSTPYLAYPVTD